MSCGCVCSPRLCVGVPALTVFVVAVVLASVWLPGVNGKVCSGQSQGVCSPNSGDCVCATGFTGESCQHAGTCQEHGTNCECEENGYWGPTCSNTCPGSTACVEVRARVDVGWSHEPCMRVWRPTVPSFCRAPAVQPRAPTTGSAPSQETAFVTKATMAPAANQVRTVVMGQHRHAHTSCSRRANAASLPLGERATVLGPFSHRHVRQGRPLRVR